MPCLSQRIQAKFPARTHALSLGLTSLFFFAVTAIAETKAPATKAAPAAKAQGQEAPAAAAPKDMLKPEDSGHHQSMEGHAAHHASSSDIRSGQQMSAGLRTGLLYTLVPGIGIEGNYHLSGDLLVGGSINVGNLSVKDEAEKSDDSSLSSTAINIDKADLKARSIGVHGRWFPLNSFFVTGGLSHRTVATEIQVSDATDSKNYIKTSTNSKSICLDLGIGNIWSFESGFYIGAEWFGISQALSSSASADSEIGGIPSGTLEDESDQNKKFAEDMGKATTYRLAMLQLGWSF